MNVSTTSFSPTQMILVWALLVLLLSWFIIFTTLALRDFVLKKVEWEDVPAPSRPIPVVGIQPDEKEQIVVGMADGTLPSEHTNSEVTRDSSASLIR